MASSGGGVVAGAAATATDGGVDTAVEGAVAGRPRAALIAASAVEATSTGATIGGGALVIPDPAN